MARYRKKPVEIEAVRWDGTDDSADAIADMCPKDRSVSVVGGTYLEIPTLEGVMTADIGDYIIKGVQGEVYPCKPDIFKATYDAVADNA